MFATKYRLKAWWKMESWFVEVAGGRSFFSFSSFDLYFLHSIIYTRSTFFNTHPSPDPKLSEYSPTREWWDQAWLLSQGVPGGHTQVQERKAGGFKGSPPVPAAPTLQDTGELSSSGPAGTLGPLSAALPLVVGSEPVFWFHVRKERFWGLQTGLSLTRSFLSNTHFTMPITVDSGARSMEGAGNSEHRKHPSTF